MCLLTIVFPTFPQAEEFYRTQIRNGSMSRARSARVSENLQVSVPFVNRVEFIEALAALTSIFKEEVSTCSGE
jgi:hypothetical protein